MISPRNATRRGPSGARQAGAALGVALSLSLALAFALGLGLDQTPTLRAAADETPKPAATRAAKTAEPAEQAADKTADPGAAPAKDQDKDKQASVWMRKKLDYSQNILAGITAGDFELVSQNANAMKGLAKIESFVRGRSPGYRAQLQIFQEANEELLRQARKENADGAALAFTQLTISCVNCHKQLREIEKK